MAADPNAVEQAVCANAARQPERIQRTSEELHQAINDLVSACASSRPSQRAAADDPRPDVRCFAFRRARSPFPICDRAHPARRCARRSKQEISRAPSLISGAELGALRADAASSA